MSNRVFIIAEAGVNHNGSLEMAYQMIEVAKACGADAVKFQTFIADEVVTKSAPKAAYQNVSSTGKTQHEMLLDFELKHDDFLKIKEHCDKTGILFLSTPFDLMSLTYLTDTLDIPIIKIASGEITNAPLLYQAALTHKPIILSTGMSTLADIEEALGVLAFAYSDKASRPSVEKFVQAYHSAEGKRWLKEKVSLLHCTSAYPTPFAEVNLKAIQTLRTTFDLPVGFSDHSQGIVAAITAVSHDMTILEKHFTLDKNLVGPDHAASLSPDELKDMITGVRIAEQCQGTGEKTPSMSESQNVEICRRSLIVKQALQKGERFATASLGIKRPATGIAPKYYWDWLEKVAEKDYQIDEMLEY